MADTYIDAETLKKELACAPVWTTLKVIEIIDNIAREQAKNEAATTIVVAEEAEE